jgi:hypothetical protein
MASVAPMHEAKPSNNSSPIHTPKAKSMAWRARSGGGRGSARREAVGRRRVRSDGHVLGGRFVPCARARSEKRRCVAWTTALGGAGRRGPTGCSRVEKAARFDWSGIGKAASGPAPVKAKLYGTAAFLGNAAATVAL